ncbi:MAG: SRPBCC family protein, partial [Paracoccaceae bacterium]
ENQMASVSVEKTVDASLSDLWASWDDFANISVFNPGVQKSFLINDSRDTGLGAERRCDLADGKNYLLERITGYIPEERLEIDIYEVSIPIKDASAVLEFKAIGPKRSKVTMTMTFTPKMGFVGRLMLPMMRAQLAKNVDELLSGNKKHVEDGVLAAA